MHAAKRRVTGIASQGSSLRPSPWPPDARRQLGHQGGQPEGLLHKAGDREAREAVLERLLGVAAGEHDRDVRADREELSKGRLTIIPGMVKSKSTQSMRSACAVKSATASCPSPALTSKPISSRSSALCSAPPPRHRR